MSDVPKLNNTNYELWVVLIWAWLTRKGVAEVLEESSKPSLGPNSPVTKPAASSKPAATSLNSPFSLPSKVMV